MDLQWVRDGNVSCNLFLEYYRNVRWKFAGTDTTDV